MKNIEQYTKSLQLIDKFIAETSATDLEALLQKYEKIQGPTFDEYLISLEESYELFCWHPVIDEHIVINDCELIGVYKVGADNSYYIPPPTTKILKQQPKKDSALNTESFFLLYLQNDRSKKSII